MLLKPVIVITAVLLCSCNGASIDGQAQEEHWDNTDRMHTIAPSKSVQPVADTFISETKLPEKSKEDTNHTATGPVHKSDNSDTTGKP